MVKYLTCSAAVINLLVLDPRCCAMWSNSIIWIVLWIPHPAATNTCTCSSLVLIYVMMFFLVCNLVTSKCVPVQVHPNFITICMAKHQPLARVCIHLLCPSWQDRTCITTVMSHWKLSELKKWGCCISCRKAGHCLFLVCFFQLYKATLRDSHSHKSISLFLCKEHMFLQWYHVFLKYNVHMAIFSFWDSMTKICTTEVG